MRMWVGRFGLAAVLALSALPVRAEGANPSAKGAAATLAVTVELKGGGVDRPASHERNITWTVADRYQTSMTMIPAAPTGFAGMHKPDAAETARESERQAAANSAAQSMQPMAEQSQRIAKMCGDDEACMQREVMKMAQSVKMNTPEMQSARANIAKASVVPEARYQVFSPGTQSGTYSVHEVSHVALFEAACSMKTEQTCAVDTKVDGEGALIGGEDGATAYPGSATAELDLERGSLIIRIGWAGIGKASQTVMSRNPQAKTGTSTVLRAPTSDEGSATVEVLCGACQSAKGRVEKTVSDPLLGRPAKMVMTWAFSRP